MYWIAVVLGIVMVGCAHSATPGPSPIDDDVAVTLVVENATRDSVGVYFIDGPMHVRLGRVAPLTDATLPVRKALLRNRLMFRVYAFRGAEACPVARVIDITASRTPRMTVSRSDSVLAGYLAFDACVHRK